MSSVEQKKTQINMIGAKGKWDIRETTSVSKAAKELVERKDAKELN